MDNDNLSLRQMWRAASRGEKWRYALCAGALIWIALQWLLFPPVNH